MCKRGTFGCPDDLLAQWLIFLEVMGPVHAGAGSSPGEGTVFYGYLSEPAGNHMRGAKTPRPKETQGGVWRSV